MLSITIQGEKKDIKWNTKIKYIIIIIIIILNMENGNSYLNMSSLWYPYWITRRKTRSTQNTEPRKGWTKGLVVKVAFIYLFRYLITVWFKRERFQFSQFFLSNKFTWSTICTLTINRDRTHQLSIPPSLNIISASERKLKLVKKEQ